MSKLWKQIHDMSAEELDAYAEAHHVDLAEEFDDLTHAANHVCVQLGVPKPAEEEDPPAGADLDEEINEYARKHKCTYSEALAALAKDPDFKRRWELIFA